MQNEILLGLKQQLKPIADLIEDKNDVLYFDYPLHLNVGDLLIYLGTEAYFQAYDIHIRLRRCVQTFDLNEVKKYVNPNTTILCHGGGNFGDLYPNLQQMREDLAGEFPQNRLIVLPQTAFFSSEAAKAKSQAVFAQHKNCYLFARDERTLKLMQDFSPNVYLSPDMAHQLYGGYPISEEQAQQKREHQLYFLRKDIEASSIEKNLSVTLPAGTAIKDWGDILTAKDHKIELWISRIARLINQFKLNFAKNQINDFWYRYAQEVVMRSYQEFSSYDEIITSRLHGHIFSCLLGIPNQVLDNSYGKNSGYFKQWTKEIDYTKLYENGSSSC